MQQKESQSDSEAWTYPVIAVIPKDELWAWKPEIRAAIEVGRKEAREGKLKAYASVDELWGEMEAEEEFNAEV